MVTHTEINNRFFKRFAPIYDLLVFPIRSFRKRVAEASGATGQLSILDVACGTGEQSIAFADAGATVTGIDLSPDMMKKAEAKVGNRTITFSVQDATHLPYPDQHFGITSISFALHDMPQEMGLTVLKEMKRVTKNGGTICIADYALPSTLFSHLFHGALGFFESRYYPFFIKKGISWYCNKAGINETLKENHMLGSLEIVVGRNV